MYIRKPIGFLLVPRVGLEPTKVPDSKSGCSTNSPLTHLGICSVVGRGPDPQSFPIHSVSNRSLPEQVFLLFETQGRFKLPMHGFADQPPHHQYLCRCTGVGIRTLMDEGLESCQHNQRSPAYVCGRRRTRTPMLSHPLVFKTRLAPPAHSSTKLWEVVDSNHSL